MCSKLTVEDAENFDIPHLLLFSKRDGESEPVQAYEKALDQKKDAKYEDFSKKDFSKMSHG